MLGNIIKKLGFAAVILLVGQVSIQDKTIGAHFYDSLHIAWKWSYLKVQKVLKKNHWAQKIKEKISAKKSDKLAWQDDAVYQILGEP